MEENFRNKALKELKKEFPQEILKVRPGPKNSEYLYVPIDHVIGRLDEVFPLSWDWSVIDSKVVGATVEKKSFDKSTQPWKEVVKVVNINQIAVLGRLTLHFPDGSKVSRDSWGGAELGAGAATGDDFKIADSFALGKAAYRFGIGAYIGLEAQEPTPPKKQNNYRNNNKPAYQKAGSETTEFFPDTAENKPSTTTKKNPFR